MLRLPSQPSPPSQPSSPSQPSPSSQPSPLSLPSPPVHLPSPPELQPEADIWVTPFDDCCASVSEQHNHQGGCCDPLHRRRRRPPQFVLISLPQLALYIIFAPHPRSLTSHFSHTSQPLPSTSSPFSAISKQALITLAHSRFCARSVASTSWF